MNKTLRLVLAGLLVWLAYGILMQAQADRKPVVLERAPLRFIKDPNPSFSAVAVDSESNMLVVSDENMFRIMEYDRRENTPPQARLSEPKRIISGTNTKAEMICGVYIDPKTKEIYALNGDTQNWMPVFSTDARGNVAPNRALNIPGHPFQLAADGGLVVALDRHIDELLILVGRPLHWMAGYVQCSCTRYTTSCSRRLGLLCSLRVDGAR